MWQQDLITRLMDLGVAGVAGAAGWGLRAIGDRRRAAGEAGERRRHVCLDLINAVGELVGFVEAHRAEWMSRRERVLTAVEALATMVRYNDLNGFKDVRKGIPDAFQTVRAWQRREVEAGRSRGFPAIVRLNAAFSVVILLGDEELTRAAQDIVDAAQHVVGAMAKGRRQRDKAKEELEAATRAFGRVSGLAPTD